MNARADSLPKGPRSKYHYGVYWRKRRKPWLVKFRRSKKIIYIGSFYHYDEACFAAAEFLKSEKYAHATPHIPERLP